MDANRKFSKKFFNSREELQKKINEALMQRKNTNTNLKNVNQIKKDFNLNANIKSKHFNDVVRASKSRSKNNFFNNTIGLNDIRDLNKNIDQFFDSECTSFMAIGGVGDLLLAMSSAYDKPNPKILFFANNLRSELPKKLLNFFNIKYLFHKNLMGTHWCSLIYNRFIKMPTFRTSGHLADDCNYADWFNVDKYKERIVTKTNWNETIGTNRLFQEKYVVLCPSGSSKIEVRRRYLSLEEYRTLVAKFLEKNYKVVTTSDENDLKTYGLFPNPNCYWMTDNNIYNYEGKPKDIDFKTFLQILNSCDECVSMDTYLKTLVLLMDKPVKVVRTRFNGEYHDEKGDCSSQIFLNKTIWPKLEIYKFEELIEVLD